MKSKIKVNQADVEFYEKDEYEPDDTVLVISGKPTPDDIIEIFDRVAFEIGLEKEEK